MPRGFLCAWMPVCRALSASFVPADFHNLCPRCYWHGTPHVVLPVPCPPPPFSKWWVPPSHGIPAPPGGSGCGLVPVNCSAMSGNRRPFLSVYRDLLQATRAVQCNKWQRSLQGIAVSACGIGPSECGALDILVAPQGIITLSTLTKRPFVHGRAEAPFCRVPLRCWVNPFSVDPTDICERKSYRN